MATTTTYAAIKANTTTKIEAITPTVMSDVEFRRGPRQRDLRAWARATPAAALRRFEIRRVGGVSDPNVVDPSAVLRVGEVCRITVAYPTHQSGYPTVSTGEDALSALEDVMRGDAKQIYDTVFSAGNYVSGQYAAIVTIEPPDVTDEDVWFQDFTVELTYLEALSFSP